MSDASGPHDEAERQRRLVDGLFAAHADVQMLPTRERGARALRGLQVYRANGQASAARALATAFPTVQMLLGDENFEQLAREFWCADPPVRGDLGEWGAALADWVSHHPGLAEWPYLADCARLDWALHACERAEDGALDAESIARLGDTEPSRLVLLAMPGLALIESAWPIGAIHCAHRGDDERAFEAARDAIAAQRGEAVLVSRQGFKAVPQVVDAATARWTQQLLASVDLASAIEHAAVGFDFGAWLSQALQSNWLKGIRVLSD